MIGKHTNDYIWSLLKMSYKWETQERERERQYSKLGPKIQLLGCWEWKKI